MSEELHQPTGDTAIVSTEQVWTYPVTVCSNALLGMGEANLE